MALTGINSEDRDHSDLAIPPGEYLEEVIGELGITKAEFAKRMEWPSTMLSRILKGVDAIDKETALKLEKMLGVPAHIRLDLDREYQATLKELRGKESSMKCDGLAKCPRCPSTSSGRTV